MTNRENTPRKRLKTAVLVAGSWGTALATVLADNGHEVVMWTRGQAQADEIRDQHTNSKYLPGAQLPEALTATTDLAEALEGAQLVLFAAPSSAMRQVASAASSLVARDAIIVHATKGFETDTLERMSHVLAGELGRSQKEIVVLSGPSHAEEVVKKLPTTVVVASEQESFAEKAQDAFINSCFRVYTNKDVTGVEVAGAIKNIIALGTGLSDGLGFGDNAKAALITRGLAEIGRLGSAMGANMMTFAGLAGVGDLVVTCTSPHSRNWRAGSMLASGLSLDEVLERMGMVVEGVRTTKSAKALSARFGVEMPITDQLYEVLFMGKEPREAVESLMLRDRTNEL
ncbi:NAD(P)H-dependent glycerol-3-phosphate dehydrogenase [Paenibacillus pasadenensis]|uniref:NAD(P)H-dependent glycerol-3-phosphate dehydrogenase n=1 Tax=Paenibacillus pasadenensis TaxID=217090 RepID=UPI00203EFFD2|nr:NAD(P)H-dependent glycerol-3-phosphate dehydrogenase [Paenibacillus pasadenensis]MCM3747388.1 NAD(P)H-dependent glycerol-3-phosphate dehydrogenase [Paenibacillus pasadenensis]